MEIACATFGSGHVNESGTYAISGYPSICSGSLKPPPGASRGDAEGHPTDGWFKPGAGKTEWFKDLDVGPEMVVVPPTPNGRRPGSGATRETNTRAGGEGDTFLRM